MITVIAHYRVQPGSADVVRELLAGHSRQSEAEPGCLGFWAHQDTEDPDRFALYERYQSAEAFAEHRQSEHFHTNIEGMLVPLLLERSWRVYGPRL
jgi:quinol monooxygenase YgiN